MGMVTLIGAGPGDAGYITVKGLEKLKKCDVVIYDRLASEELLSAVREDCVCVYVGKKPGAHTMKQEEINRVLVDYATRYEDVVRLKGGDPFVFGRGGEEIQALMQAGIAYEVIPGVSSAVAVPELAGIPVTHRGIARSFHVVTGHTKEDGTDTITEDYEALAQLSGTLVFLMGLAHIEQITGQLLKYKKAPDTPAAVIAEGATPFTRIVRGTLADIAERVRAEGLVSPVIIVIGETAAFDFRCRADCRENAPGVAGNMLQHRATGQEAAFMRRCGVVGTEATLSAFSERMQEKRGSYAPFATVPLIVMQTKRLEEYGQLQKEVRQIASYDWIYLTSRQAVTLFFEALREQQTDLRVLSACRFAVIGKGTREALLSHGIHADFMPSHADTETFANEFVRMCSRQADTDGSASGQWGNGKGECRKTAILFPHAAQADKRTAERLREADIKLTECVIYDVIQKRCGDFARLTELTDLAFFSSSGVRAFFDELRKSGRSLPAECQIWCIGNPTRETVLQELKKQGASLELHVAEEASVDGLAEAVSESLSKGTAAAAGKTSQHSAADI